MSNVMSEWERERESKPILLTNNIKDIDARGMKSHKSFLKLYHLRLLFPGRRYGMQ